MILRILALLILSFYFFETKGSDPFAIKLNNSTPLQFCSEPVLVASQLTIEGTPNIQGMKISISGFVQGEDELVYSGNLTSKWWDVKGELELTGSTNVQDYVDAIRSVSYINNKSIPTLGLRKITISLNDADYLPDTQHFYRFQTKIGCWWSQAKAESEKTTYYGLQGYLATITSQAENDFIRLKTKGVGYIGASDAAVEGEWRWVTGPEGLENSGKGRLFWKGTGDDYANKVPGSGPYMGAYNNWQTSNNMQNLNEPNNGGGNEDFGHITVFPNDPLNSYKWNDVVDTGGTGPWSPQGYLIEFGGMPNDPVLNLTATAELQVNTMLFNTSPIPSICEGSGYTLNQPDTSKATYLWAPAASLSSPTIANPVASPLTTTTYTVTGTRGSCSATTSYTVNVNPKPASLLNPEENICKGNNITLNPGNFQTYDWGNGIKTSTITVGTAGNYTVKVVAANACAWSFSSSVVVHDYPTIDLTQLQTLICGDSKTTSVNIASNAQTFVIQSIDQKATVNSKDVTVTDFGVYPMKYTAIDTYCPISKDFALSFYPNPVVNLGNDVTVCNPGTALLDAGNQFSAYQWSTKEASAQITVKDPGYYSVNVTDHNGCRDSDTVHVAFTDKPKIDISKLDTLICGTFATTLNVSSDKSVTWLLESTNPNAGINQLTVAVAPANFGRYPFTLTAKDEFSCVSAAAFDVAFYKIPVVGFTIDDQKCYGYNLDASYEGDADIARARFTWVFGGDTIVDAVGHNQEKIPLGVNQSKRDLVLTVEQDGCSAQHTISDIRVIPTLSLSVKDTILCQPKTFEFLASNTETGVSYDWNFGDNTTGKGVSPTHNYTAAGKYDIELTVTTDKNCTNTALVKNMVYVAPVPTIGFTLANDICLTPGKHEVSYAGSGNARDKYIWGLSALDLAEIVQNPDSTQGPLVFNLVNKPTAPVALKVVSEFGCQSRPATITLKRQPDFSMAFPSTAGCIPFVATMSATISDPVDRVNFDWNFGDGSSDKGASATHTYNVAGKSYFVSLNGTSTITGCSSTLNDNNMLRTFPKPSAAFSLDNKVVYNDKPDINFTDNSIGANQFLWEFGDGTSSSVQNPSHHFVRTGHLKVFLEVSNQDQCTDTVSHEVLVAFDRLFPPNAFSPNAANSIDREYKLNSEGITTEGYHFTIISRWNDIVFETKGAITGWDGRMQNGNFAPPGNYLWILNYTDFLGRNHRQTGTVTLFF